MNRIFYTTKIIAILLLIAFISCDTDDNQSGLSAGIDEDFLPGHPRIMLLEGEEEDIHQSITDNPIWQRMHEAILAESDAIIDEPVLEREVVGRRLLGTSREALRRVFYLSYSYRMTEEDKYAERAEREMLAAANFSDWNPSHFLDVGEMTMALAIGYDWLNDQLSAESRETIREAILEKGLEPSFDPDYNWFLEATHNWNQVCNAGLTYGALAVYDHYPEISEEVIERALETIPLAKKDYRPDGAYPEGYGYWGYGTSFNILFLSAIDKVWPGGFDYSDHSAFLETGSFRKHMIGPTFQNFNWGDNRPSAGLSPSMFWYADKNSEPSLLYKEKLFLDTDDFSQFTNNRRLPAILIWGKDIQLDEITEPENYLYVAQGAMPLSIMRTSWSDPNAIYLGFKGGSPSVNHGHMDIGSFVMESDGVRWSSDLGPQNYHSLEELGMNIWGMSQDSERWTVYRLNNFSHSTLTVNGELQLVDGYSKIENYSDDPEFYFGITDMSSVYENDLASVIRGAGIVDQMFVVIRDEIESSEEPAEVRWQMLTEADVTITGANTATLTRDGQQLYLRVDQPSDIEVTTWSTQPDTEHDVENPGTILVGFETNLSANTSEILQVSLIPASSGTVTEFDQNLADW
ncbi:MAG: heparinase II/III family protein [Balneolaceae bacterium]|nr:heparinase II/III family protein [Balneolaceae bacterium]